MSYHALTSPEQIAIVEVASEDDVNKLLTLAAPLESDFSALDTVLSEAILARWAEEKLTIKWSGPDDFTASVRLAEVPWEYATPVGENMDDTIGALEAAPHLYRFTYKDPDEPVVTLVTGAEADVVIGADTWVSRDIEFSEIRDALWAEDDKVTLKARTWAGCPLTGMIFQPLEWPLVVEIIEAMPDGEGGYDLATLYTGEVQTVAADGPLLTAKVSGFGRVLDQDLPAWLITPTCNVSIFSGPCGLAVADWKFTGTLTSVSGFTCQVGTITPPAGKTIGLNEFAGGWLEVVVAGQRLVRAIMSSTTGSTITLNLTADLTADALGETVEFWPGCGGDYSRCIALGNRARFKAFPFVPVGNPSMVKMPDNRKMK